MREYGFRWLAFFCIFVTVPENAVQRKLAFFHVLRGAVQSTVKREVKYHKKRGIKFCFEIGTKQTELGHRKTLSYQATR